MGGIGRRRIVICLYQWVAEQCSICNRKIEESVRLLCPGPTSQVQSATGRILMRGILGGRPRVKPLIDACREEPEQVLMCGSLCCFVIRLPQSQSAEWRDARWDHTLSHRLGSFRPTSYSVKKKLPGYQETQSFIAVATGRLPFTLFPWFHTVKKFDES